MPPPPDLHTRAVTVFGSSTEGAYWPYGLNNTSRRPAETLEAWQQRQTDLTRRREIIVEWAERYALKASTVQCCPAWLVAKVSRHCRRCGPGGQGTTMGPDRDWLDHPVYWLKDSRPAVITSAPYGISAEATARIAWWTKRHPQLSTAQGDGWYGFTTTQIVMWNAERIGSIEPAAGAPC